MPTDEPLYMYFAADATMVKEKTHAFRVVELYYSIIVVRANDMDVTISRFEWHLFANRTQLTALILQGKVEKVHD